MFGQTWAFVKRSPTGKRMVESSATFSALWEPLFGTLIGLNLAVVYYCRKLLGF